MSELNINKNKVQNPYGCNFIKMMHPNLGERKQSYAERLIAYRAKYHISRKNFAQIANSYAIQYNTRVTESDIRNYENYDMTPKIDKALAISRAMGMDIDYFCGFGSSNRKSRNPIMEARYQAYKQNRK